MKVKRTKFVILAVASILILTACGSVSTLKSSWLKEKYTFKNDQAQKVLIIAMAKDETIRRKAEDNMKSMLYGKGAEIETSYQFIKYGTETEKLLNFIQLGDFTHILTMRVANVDKEIEYKSGGYYGGYYRYPTYYRTYGGYFNSYWYGSGYYEPGHYEESVEYTVETNVYSVKEKELVYSALTSSFKGSGLDQTILSTLENVAKDLKKRGLVNTAKK
ncbi:hypothetical protein ACIRNY_00795 [Capnocytophaga canimorsus]|uniref:hypothetical protein n=1 Tax=Capnocytophaga canimorsus TaxID=28188 RepID=UPI003850686C